MKHERTRTGAANLFVEQIKLTELRQTRVKGQYVHRCGSSFMSRAVRYTIATDNPGSLNCFELLRGRPNPITHLLATFPRLLSP